MRVIYKYPIPIRSSFTLDMPSEARMLSFQVQYGVPTLWALVNLDSPKARWVFKLLGTGDPQPNDEHLANYIGTIQHEGYVWHLFHAGCQLFMSDSSEAKGMFEGRGSG